MHFEILVEDQSGKKALDILVPKIIGDAHTFNVHPYKGIGRIPKNLGNKADVSLVLVIRTHELSGSSPRTYLGILDSDLV